MSDKNNEGSQTKKRNRGLLSCTECHRRKQKCDRLQPCNDCIQRGLPQRCMYIKPAKPALETDQPGSRKATKSRLKRIMTGEEVLLSHESVESLASSSFDATASLPLSTLPLRANATPVPNPKDVDDADPEHETYPKGGTGWMSPRAAGSFPLTRVAGPTVSSGLNAGIQFRFLGGFDPFASFPGCNEEPIPKQLLVHYYVARLAPWLSYLDDSIGEDDNSSARLGWLEFAINHTPLFYATLLTAVVHLNRRRPLKDPSAMIWFKVQTMRLANEKMNDPAEACKDEMLIVALILLYFNVRGNNAEEYEIHLRGIHDMLKLRGGKGKLGMRGMVKNWLDICYGPWSPGWEYGYYTGYKGRSVTDRAFPD